MRIEGDPVVGADGQRRVVAVCATGCPGSGSARIRLVDPPPATRLQDHPIVVGQAPVVRRSGRCEGLLSQAVRGSGVPSIHEPDAREGARAPAFAVTLRGG